MHRPPLERGVDLLQLPLSLRVLELRHVKLQFLALNKAAGSVEASTHFCGVDVSLIAALLGLLHTPVHHELSRASPPRIKVREEDVKDCAMVSSHPPPLPFLYSFPHRVGRRLTDVWLAHVCCAWRHELAHQRVPDITVLALREPVALLMRLDGVGVRVVDVPARGAHQPVPVVRVDDLEPVQCRVFAVPRRLAPYGSLDGCLAGGQRGEEERQELAGRRLEAGKFAADEGVKLVVGLETDQLEGDGGGWMVKGCTRMFSSGT